MAQINLSMRDYCETIPHFDGDPLNISTLISSCDSFVQILARPNDAAFNSFLFRAIISKLNGKVAQIASVRNTTSWDALRTLLVYTFSDRRNELTLISELQRLEQYSNESAEQYSNESAIDFGERCLNQLSLLTARINVTEQNAALRQNKIDLYRGLALQTFINGLREPMRIIMQCRTPTNLEEALNYAQEQENLQMQKHRQTIQFLFPSNQRRSAHNVFPSNQRRSAHNVSHHNYSVIKPLSEIFNENLQHKFHIFDVNPNYDGLIGLDLLKELNATIDLKNNRLLTRNAVIPIHSSENKIQNQSRQISSLKKLTIPPRCAKIVKIPVNTIQGEKYLPYQKFKPNLEIPASIVNVENSECYTTIINSSDNEQYFDIETPMEVDDFEIPTNESQMPNFDKAQVKDGTMSTYTKSYRYSHIHKEEEVRKQKWHMVNDYRKLNKHTNADALSRIELNPLETESMIVNIDDEELEELLDTDENIRSSAEEMENIINDLE
ncbi:hypothetical protein QE152_g4155 [Popillia japonica]|uniref:Uncharacterized protein n=1 Tax=Popillia japonica TaxID=7064 RepID=A0AAW1MXS5_POPJA